MSAAVFPSNLPGQIQEMWSSSYSTRILRSVSGKEVRAAWGSAARRRFKVTFNFLRDNAACPAPNAAYTETGLLRAFLDTHKGGWDSFSITCPIDGTSVTVRLMDDSISFTRVVAHVWASSFEVIEVL
jgi:hypothetical protein